MNIIYIHTHDTGRYIQPYGYHIPTPNLMELAKEGTLFRQAYCAGPTCSPSRAGLLTGMAPHSCDMLGLAHRGFKMSDYSKHLARFLNRNGYKTALFGTQHEAVNPEVLGYQITMVPPRTREDTSCTQWDMNNASNAAEYIKTKHDQPFFLSFGMFSTHREFPELKDVNPDYVVPPFPLADTEENRLDMARYIESAKVADHCVGVVMNALKESGYENDTLVFFTTDHGVAFPKMKCSLYDTGIGVSLIIKYKGNKMKGKAVNTLVSQIDIFPTLCDLLKLDHPDWLQGKSFLPVLEGETEEIRNEIFSEVTFHAAYEPMRCIRTLRYKLIRFFDVHDRVIPANIDDGYSKKFLIDHGYLEQRREGDMLFDLHLDPVERVNLISDKRYEGIRVELAQRLNCWMEETKDPVLKGRVRLPEGAVANGMDSLSPREATKLRGK